MPEIKTAFNQGKMNKDLDERLIPSGQYRDALNIEITSAEQGGAGTARNIIGNTSVDNSLIPAVDLNASCVGSIANDRTNKLYWFVKAQGVDAILEYDQTLNSSQFIAVDMAGAGEYATLKPFLDFTGAQITGINIIDDFLFWTDGNSEPKKLNISRSYQENPTAQLQDQEHAYLYVDDVQQGHLEEKHVTVIRRKPSIAPTVKINTAKDSIETPIFEKIFPRFCFRYKYQDGEYSAFGPFTQVVFNPEYRNLINSSNSYITDEPYNKSMVNLIESVELFDFVPADIPDDVVQVDILYKQENSPVIYSVANIKYTDDEWNESGSAQFIEGLETSHRGKYVISSEIIQAALPENQFLRPFDTVPKSALAQEIIGNRLVYGNYKQGYNFNGLEPKVNIGREARYDQDFTKGGLKSLKSLRKYQLGVVLGDEYGRETPVLTSNGATTSLDWSSTPYGLTASSSIMLNGKITTQLPDWVDYYKFYVKFDSGEYYNLIMDRSYFPYTHSAFENPDDHFYITFPSSDRNKLTEDDYIIAKKIYDASDSGQITENNRYKILDISNNAPEAVKYVFENLGVVSNSTGVLAGNAIGDTSGEEALFPLPTNNEYGLRRIDQETDTIAMSRNLWLSNDCDGAPLVTENAGDVVNRYNKDIFISWSKTIQGGESHSERYKVTSVEISDDNDIYKLKLSKRISNKDAKLAALNDTISQDTTTLDPNLTFRVSRRELREAEDFSGKFFVKIKHEAYLTNLNEFVSDEQLYVTASGTSNWLYSGRHNSTSTDETQFVVNSPSDSQPDPNDSDGATADMPDDLVGITGLLNIADEWDILAQEVGDNFFIDDIRFLASNPGGNSQWYARESGCGWQGSRESYEPAIWRGSEFLFSGFTGEETNYPGFSLSAYRSLTPRIIISGNTAALLEGDIENTIINSVGGISETTISHTLGSRRWITDSLYRNVPNPDTQPTYSSYPNNFDTTYGEEEGKFFMHLSFLAPGVDLIDSLDLTGVELQGKNSIASRLEGIWGGGVFTKKQASVPTDYLGGSIAISENFGDGTLNHIEFEGNYDDENNPLDETPGYYGGTSVGQGYNGSFRERHEEQWNPAFPETSQSQNIQVFIANLKTPDAKFRFKADPAGTVYTIKSVQEKHLYNHTSWRDRNLWNGTNFTNNTFNSVEHAASLWADTIDSNNEPSLTETFGDETKAQLLINKILDFGASHNRRTCYVIELDKNPAAPGNYDPRVGATVDGSTVGQLTLSLSDDIEFLTNIPPAISGDLFSSPTIWETEPQQLPDLNIYYEASNNIPTRIQGKNKEIFAPVGCEVKLSGVPEGGSYLLNEPEIPQNIRLVSWDDNETFTIEPGLSVIGSAGDEVSYTGAIFQFCREDGSYTQARIFDNIPVEEGAEVKTQFNIQVEVDPSLAVGLDWFNCFSFGDGIESNRIRDGYNNMQITSGARVSATIEETFIEEHRTNGLIYSGIYNSNSNVNNLNQFIAGEKITKDLNPVYGSIQKLYTRDTDLITLCEDKVLKILANKDALFNADGNPQLIATEKVLGQAVPFAGDYGISTHPESFAAESYRAYFADKQRGAVLRLSKDGLTPISDEGMRDYFRDNLVNNAQLLGTYDNFNKHYNLTIKPKIFATPIVNDDLSEGEAVQEFFDNDDLITDGNFNNGADWEGDNTIQELLNENEDLLTPYNFDLTTQTQVINYPAIEPGDIEPQGDPVGVVEGQDVLFQNYAENASPTMFGFTGLSDTATSMFDSDIGVSVPSHPTSFYINRYSNHSDGIMGGDADDPTPNANFTWYDETDEENITQSFSYQDTNLPFDDKLVLWQGPNYPGFGTFYLGGATYDINTWKVPVAIFYQASTTYNTNVFNSSITPSGIPDNWSTTAPKKGITFRGAPDNGYFGNVVIPADFVSGEASEVVAEVAESLPNNNHSNATIYNGEEVQVTINWQANNVGTVNSCRLRVEILDGYDLVSNTFIQTLADGGPVDYGGQSSNFFATSGAYSYMGSASVSTTSTDTTGPKSVKFKWKFYDGTSTAKVLVENLKVRIHVETGNGEGGQDGNEGDMELVNLGELVIKGFRVKKLRKYIQPFVEADPGQPGSDPVPLTLQPAWQEVIHTEPINGIDENSDTSNLFRGNELIYGVANPPVAYQQDGVTYPDWLVGSNPVHPDTGVTISNLEPGFYNVSGDQSFMKLNPGGAFNHKLDTDLIQDHWYLVDMIVVDDQGEVITDLDDNSYNIQLYGVLPNDFAVGSSPVFSYGGWGYSQNTYNSSVRNLELRTTHSANEEYTGRGEKVLRGLFKASSESAHGLNNHLNVNNLGDQEIHFSHLRVIDITDNDFSGGSFDNWSTDPENYHIERARVHNTSPEYHFPQVYYHDGKANMYQAYNDHLKQAIPGFVATNDGYKLRFKLSSASGVGSGGANALGGLELRVNSSDYQIVFNNFTVEGAFNSLGTYEAIINPQEGFENTLTRVEENNGTPVNDLVQTVQTIPYSGEATPEIDFYANQSAYTYCSIDKVSLVDITNYFSLSGSEGSGVEGWIIDGFDQELEDFITWDDGAIQFNDSPVLHNAFIFQPLEEDLVLGYTYELSFDFVGEQGNLLVGYFNSNGEGFIQTIDATDESGHIQANVIVGDNSQSSLPTMPGGSIFIASHTAAFTGTIDNVFLKRVITLDEFETHPQTITYNEDVKGWTSFKSFIPESGVSLSNQYFTMESGKLWQHYTNPVRNSFYNSAPYNSTITAVLNAESSTIKNFTNIIYEGSQSRVEAFESPFSTVQVIDILDAYGETNSSVIDSSQIYNTQGLNGWSVSSIVTEQDAGSVSEFIEKEGKWFNYIYGNDIDENGTIDTSKFNFQGLGVVTSTQNG